MPANDDGMFYAQQVSRSSDYHTKPIYDTNEAICFMVRREVTKALYALLHDEFEADIDTMNFQEFDDFLARVLSEVSHA